MWQSVMCINKVKHEQFPLAIDYKHQHRNKSGANHYMISSSGSEQANSDWMSHNKIHPLSHPLILFKVIIFISLERSCVTLHSEWLFFLISILLSSYLDFCEKTFFLT